MSRQSGTSQRQGPKPIREDPGIGVEGGRNISLNWETKPGMLVHAYNLSTRETETGRL
jgi:hypothetical protein